MLGGLSTDGRYDDRDVFNWEDYEYGDLDVDYILPQRYAQDPVWPAGREPGLWGMESRVVLELVYGRLARVEEWSRVRSRVARAVAARVYRVALQARPEMGVGRVTRLGRYPGVRNRRLQR